MKRATISQLKNKLSAYLRRVRSGESVLILDRDEPVARLIPIAGAGDADERLLRLERAGILRRSAKPMLQFDVSGEEQGAGARVLDALLEDRRGGR